jgi:hypothetical protein
MSRFDSYSPATPFPVPADEVLVVVEVEPPVDVDVFVEVDPPVGDTF